MVDASKRASGMTEQLAIFNIANHRKLYGYINPNWIRKSSAFNCSYSLGFFPLWEKLCEIQKCRHAF